MDIDRQALEEWQKHQPLAILQLDPSDRVVLRVAGRNWTFFAIDNFMEKYFAIDGFLWLWHDSSFFREK